MAHKKSERIYTSNVEENMPKAAEEEHSDAAWIGFRLEKHGVKTTSFHFVGPVLVEMAQNDAPDKVYDWDIER